MTTQTNSTKVTLFVHDSGSHCRFAIAEDGTIAEIHTGGIDAARVCRRGKADLTGTPEEIRAEVERAFRIGDGCEDYVATIEDATPTPQPEQEQQETAAPAARSEAAVEAAFQSAEKLIETSEDISSALIWLTSSTEDASRRIRGAIECLRKCQPARKAANEAFMAATA